MSTPLNLVIAKFTGLPPLTIKTLGLPDLDELILSEPRRFRDTIDVPKSFPKKSLADYEFSVGFGKEIGIYTKNTRQLAPYELLTTIAELQALKTTDGNPSSDIVDRLVQLAEEENLSYSCLVDRDKVSLDEALNLAKGLLREITVKRCERNELSLDVVDGYVEFSVEAAIKEARAKGVDEGKFLGALLGINSDVIRPGILFIYDKETPSTVEWGSVHDSSNNRSEKGVAEMFVQGAERISDQYRIYYAGRSNVKGRHDDFTYIVHEIGHDIWFTTLTNEQRAEFTELLKIAQGAHKDRIGSNAYVADWYKKNLEASTLLADPDTFITISEAFALALGNHVGHPIFSGKLHHGYVSDLRTMEILRPFFEKYNFKDKNSKQPSVDDVARNNPAFISKLDLIGLARTKDGYPKSVKEAFFPPLVEQVRNDLLISTFLTNPQKLESNIDQMLCDLNV